MTETMGVDKVNVIDDDHVWEAERGEVWMGVPAEEPFECRKRCVFIPTVIPPVELTGWYGWEGHTNLMCQLILLVQGGQVVLRQWRERIVDNGWCKVGYELLNFSNLTEEDQQQIEAHKPEWQGELGELATHQS